VQPRLHPPIHATTSLGTYLFAAARASHPTPNLQVTRDQNRTCWGSRGLGVSVARGTEPRETPLPRILCVPVLIRPLLTVGIGTPVFALECDSCLQIDACVPSAQIRVTSRGPRSQSSESVCAGAHYLGELRPATPSHRIPP